MECKRKRRSVGGAGAQGLLSDKLLPERSWRDAEHRPKPTDKVRCIGEPGLGSDLRDGSSLGEHVHGVFEPNLQEIRVIGLSGFAFECSGECGPGEMRGLRDRFQIEGAGKLALSAIDNRPQPTVMFRDLEDATSCADRCHNRKQIGDRRESGDSVVYVGEFSSGPKDEPSLRS